MITISEPTAKYLLALLLDPAQRSAVLTDHASEELAEKLFGDNATHLTRGDAVALHVEALRSGPWAQEGAR